MNGNDPSANLVVVSRVQTSPTSTTIEVIVSAIVVLDSSALTKLANAMEAVPYGNDRAGLPTATCNATCMADENTYNGTSALDEEDR